MILIFYLEYVVIIETVLSRRILLLLIMYYIESHKQFMFPGKIYKFLESKWQEVSFEDSLKLTKTEGQVQFPS